MKEQNKLQQYPGREPKLLRSDFVTLRRDAYRRPEDHKIYVDHTGHIVTDGGEWLT